MAGSPPSRPRSFQWASPGRSISEILAEDRNSETRHKTLLEAARKEHERVREEAERVYRDHLQKEEQQRLLEEKRKEEERIRRDEQIAAERVRINALRAKKVEIPAPLPEPVPEPPKPPAPAPTPPTPKAPEATPKSTGLFNGTTTQKSAASTGPSVSDLLNSAKLQPTSQPTPQPPATTLFGTVKPTPAAPTVQGQTNGAVAAPQAAPPAQRPPPQAQLDRYTVIHRNLKALRKSMVEQAKTNRELKGRMGDMRREIRKSVGQLTSGAGGVNSKQQQTILAQLREALANQVRSQLVDPSDFVFEPRHPVQGAQHNEQLPSLFIYLLNLFAKNAIGQFINEGGARPETADPVGVCLASTFSEPDFHWRDKPLIDILIAKFRIVCPVLFGYRGSEKTEQGRERLGWWKDNGEWIAEQQHMDRMTGLGAGFAAISLRNFAKAKKNNPYPPRHYWTAMSKIVNTPAGQISNTQCVVLKSMIQNYEQKFLGFYGTAAIAALRVCLYDFPAKVPADKKTAAINSLRVLATQLQKDSGLVL